LALLPVGMVAHDAHHVHGTRITSQLLQLRLTSLFRQRSSVWPFVCLLSITVDLLFVFRPVAVNDG
jgi:hypothetical protein